MAVIDSTSRSYRLLTKYRIYVCNMHMNDSVMIVEMLLSCLGVSNKTNNINLKRDPELWPILTPSSVITNMKIQSENLFISHIDSGETGIHTP